MKINRKKVPLFFQYIDINYLELKKEMNEINKKALDIVKKDIKDKDFVKYSLTKLFPYIKKESDTSNLYIKIAFSNEPTTIDNNTIIYSYSEFSSLIKDHKRFKQSLVDNFSKKAFPWFVTPDKGPLDLQLENIPILERKQFLKDFLTGQTTIDNKKVTDLEDRDIEVLRKYYNNPRVCPYRVSSIVDYPYKSLPKDLWDEVENGYKLKPKIKEEIENIVEDVLNKVFKNHKSFFEGIILGSSLGTQFFTDISDLDIKILLDEEEVLKQYESIDEAIKTLRENKYEIEGHPIDWYIYDMDEVTTKSFEDKYDSIYDIAEDKWIKEPTIISIEDFPREKILERGKERALEVARRLDLSLGEIKRSIQDYDHLKEYLKSLDSKERSKFLEEINKILLDLEKEIEEIIETKKDVIEERHKGFKMEFTPDIEKFYYSINWLPENIQMKLLNWWKYLSLASDLEEFLEDNKITEEEIPKIEKVIKESQIEEPYENIDKAIDRVKPLKNLWYENEEGEKIFPPEDEEGLDFHEKQMNGDYPYQHFKIPELIESICTNEGQIVETHSTFGADKSIILYLVNKGWTLIDSITLAVSLCERCMNILIWEADNEPFDYDYLEKSNTWCEQCELIDPVYDEKYRNEHKDDEYPPSSPNPDRFIEAKIKDIKRKVIAYLNYYWKLAKEKQVYEKASIQTSNIPESLTNQIKDIQKLIPEDKLNKNADDGDWIKNGLQDLIHITILYGIKDEDVDKAKEIVDRYKDIKIRASELDYFDDNENNYTVLVVKCDSNDLENLHEDLKEEIENDHSYEFQSHLTIAYLNLNERVEDLNFRPISWEIKSVEISKTTGSIEKISNKEAGRWRSQMLDEIAKELFDTTYGKLIEEDDPSLARKVFKEFLKRKKEKLIL